MTFYSAFVSVNHWLPQWEYSKESNFSSQKTGQLLAVSDHPSKKLGKGYLTYSIFRAALSPRLNIISSLEAFSLISKK